MHRISSLFRRNAELATLANKTDSLTALQKTWANVAPNSLKQLTEVASLDQGKLTVFTSNGAIAAKINLLLPSLLTKLQKQGVEVTAIRVQVQVKSTPRKPPKIARKISTQAASGLDEFAQKLEGTALGEALSRLAKRT